ncbi:MAG TPA: helix-turn-helix domain-containing protein [Gemmatimonadaceae bacterium]|jgi:DNA-binding HxlR family transcriptional regulator|nr:helix-turn-helix domain-containing protein [Gemmatimonadaceae bacterium]
MAKRSYNQYCGLARALDVVGERWTLLIVRNLLLGPQRYTDLLRGLPGITTNLLAKRLKEMEALGLIEQGSGADGSTAYLLTGEGQSLEPAIHALGRWGWRRMGKPSLRDRRSIDWLLVALRRRYRGGEPLAAQLEVDGAPYHMVLRGERAEIGRGGVPAADLRIRGSAADIARLFLEGLPSGSEPAGLEVAGTKRQLRSLVDAFTRGDT